MSLPPAAPKPSRFALDCAAPPAPRMLRLCAGFVYFYFGFVKFYTDLSPAEMLASQTIMRIWPWHVDADSVLFWLSVVEVVIGLSLMLNMCLRWVLWIFLLHQLGTFLPLVLYPELCFKFVPFAPTIEGQYILKNLISLAAVLTVMMPAVRGATARDRLAKEAKAAARAEAAAAHAAETAPIAEAPAPAAPGARTRVEPATVRTE